MIVRFAALLAISIVLLGCDRKTDAASPIRLVDESGRPLTPPAWEAAFPAHAEADWLFEKKFRCAQLRPALEKNISFMVEFFYSPRLNTCVYTWLRPVPGGTPVMQANDGLTMGPLFNGDGTREEFNRRVDELKQVEAPSHTSNPYRK